MNNNSYDATVSYDSERISLIDRNAVRIAGHHNGRQITDYTAFAPGTCSRKLSYAFVTKLKRQQFIVEMRKFLKTADFGVTVSVERVEE